MIYRKIGIVVLIGLLTTAISWLTVRSLAHGFSISEFLSLLLPIGAVLLLLAAVRPIIVAIAILAFAFVNPSLLPTLAEFGELSVRYFDIFFGILVFGVFIRMMIQKRILVSREFRELFAPILAFLLYIGISLVWVWFYVPNFLATSVASYLRLIVTILFAFMLFLSFTSKHDLATFHKALITFGLATVAIGAWEAWSGVRLDEVGLSGRFAGLLGYNSFGLVSGLLVLYAFIKKDAKGSDLTQWLVPLIFGLFGLFLAKSVSSVLATAGSVGFYMASRPKRIKMLILSRWVTVGMLVLIGAASAIWFLRREDVLGFFTMSSGSFAQRLMIAYAGFKIFLEHPLMGVGWQASATETFVGSYNLNIALMERFPGLPEHYFFLKKPTSLHNMYIQFLAELGIIGFALFVYACFRVGKVVVNMLRTIPSDSPYKSWAKFHALGLIFLLIWQNTNPLFGGQTESILIFTFLATLASIARFCRIEIGKVSDKR